MVRRLTVFLYFRSDIPKMSPPLVLLAATKIFSEDIDLSLLLCPFGVNILRI